MGTINHEITEEQADTFDGAAAAPADDSPDERNDEAPVRKKKKSKKGPIIFLILLVLALGAAAAWYFMERQKPADAVEEYLTNVKNMDFDGMKTLLQSNDMSALDNADITDDAYTAFFQSINQKMTFSIKKISFSIQNGTAQVTAHIKYVDATEIYEEALTDFLKQIVSSAFAGESLTNEEIQQKLASLLAENAESADLVYVEEDIVYPLIQTDKSWKIVSLDDDTVRIMSGNFTNVQDEIDQSITELESGGESDSSEAESSSPAATDTIDMTNDKFAIQYTAFRVTEDFSGASCLLVYYNYSNNGSSASSAMVDVSLRAYQNGEALEAAIPAADEPAIDQYMTEVSPGQTVSVCQAFSLKDTSDVTLKASEALTLGGGETTSQILTIQ